jgi:hypothetical protein
MSCPMDRASTSRDSWLRQCPAAKQRTIRRSTDCRRARNRPITRRLSWSS